MVVYACNLTIWEASTGKSWVQGHPGLYIYLHTINKTKLPKKNPNNPDMTHKTNWIGKFTTVYSWHMRWEKLQGIILKWGFRSTNNSYNSLLCSFMIMRHLFFQAFSKSFSLAFFTSIFNLLILFFLINIAKL